MKPVLVLQHVPHESLGTLEGRFRDAGLAWQYVELHRDPVASLEELPLEDAAGLVVLGGPMNVDEVDRYPFLGREIRWIGQALAMELPTLGVCLGAQLLAKTAGARVYPNSRKEIGWYEIEILPAAAHDRLFAETGPVETVFQWHGDTFDLPGGAVHLAKSDLCPHQAIRCGPAAWGVQFHIEMTMGLVESWLVEAENLAELAGLDYIDPEEIRARSPEAFPAMRALGDRVLARFATACRDHA